jgi:small-conductance mechanosensitive channel
MVQQLKEYVDSPILLFLILLIASAIIGLVVRLIFFGVLSFVSKRSNRKTIKSLKSRFNSSLFMFVPLLFMQIAFTQPIKIDDNVVVEGEWGWIEEINLTYVVVKIWDKRRLILPITYFTEQTYQNWTRNSSDILGTVFLYMDYTIPIDEVRKQFVKILESTPLWDKEAQVLQIVDSTERSMNIRLLMSARNAPQAWDLRCYVREKMIVYIQENYPEALPKSRVSLEKLDELERKA